MYKGIPNDGCTSIDGITTQLCIYRFLKYTGICNTTCQVYGDSIIIPSSLGFIIDTYSPAFNNNGAV